MITGIPKDKLTKDSTGEGNRCDILLRAGFGVCVLVENFEHGVDRTNHTLAKAIREQTYKRQCAE